MNGRQEEPLTTRWTRILSDITFSLYSPKFRDGVLTTTSKTKEHHWLAFCSVVRSSRVSWWPDRSTARSLLIISYFKNKQNVEIFRVCGQFREWFCFEFKHAIWWRYNSKLQKYNKFSWFLLEWTEDEDGIRITIHASINSRTQTHSCRYQVVVWNSERRALCGELTK